MELDGLVAAVTGGASGLGAAIVDGLYARGAHVVYGDLRDRPDPPWAGRDRDPGAGPVEAGGDRGAGADRGGAGGFPGRDEVGGSGCGGTAGSSGRDEAGGSGRGGTAGSSGRAGAGGVSGRGEVGGSRCGGTAGGSGRGGPVYQRLDVCDRGSWELFAEAVRDRYGRLDILVNNAGVSARKGLLETGDDDWERVLRTNLWGPWTGIRTFAEELTASPHASVVNIGSIYGQVPPPGPPSPPSSVAYQVSKAGLHMLTRTAAVELADRGIRVNSVLPGVFVTPLLQELSDEQLRPRVQRAPMGRAGDPADVAAAVAYLASPAAAFVTGVLLPVDGGYTAS
ncbi:SDR family NAD(P)-dependent oxidoreductase [Nonomuraea aridisoli]|uniref:SDR family oxidoreductase n=1 Tax=Nonomuraea aridisoli TaxID=2070368 RepID=A0A2W2FCW6_9ACTN|nr:SDR family oxidoreductase [Nonomuraea aridisoli]PZG13344.1 hypothetical protein C1J01_30285 [Nonomuraea aridisoli]